MRAIELRIVFEDDEGKTYVRTYGPLNDPHRWLGKFMEGLEAADGEYYSLPPHETIGPVLRKVTEVEGHVEDWPGDEAYISGTNKRPAMLSSVIPDEARKDCTTYRFRFDVTAVRVPDPERDARELCGLPPWEDKP